MARSLFQTLTHLAPFSTTNSAASATRFINFRRRSSPPERISGEEEAEMERIALKKLEDAVHRIIVKKSEPTWLPLVPGASYWVPPTSKSRGFTEVVAKLATNWTASRMKKQGDLSLFSSRGWPSSAHFFKGASHSPLEVETTSKHSSQSEDEEK